MLNRKKAEEEEKKKPKKAKKPESEKARKTKRRIIIFLYVAGIALCIATLTYVMIYFYIENGVFGDDDWRETDFYSLCTIGLWKMSLYQTGYIHSKKSIITGFRFMRYCQCTQVQ